MQINQEKMREDIAKQSGFKNNEDFLTRPKIDTKSDEKAETGESIKHDVMGMMKDLDGYKQNLMLLTLVPILLEDYKDSDAEFYYTSRSELKKLTTSLKNIAEKLDHILTIAPEKKKASKDKAQANA